ncbi:response regulator [uncultured Rhodoblastus sp.]|uniref:response regulator n=1 Tax=uncultured Rhodoblastus sp. TaxID=543037 RepID=UPI0025CBBF99|nr:response regulator [uncultured Rhodoblastus sp.]
MKSLRILVVEDDALVAAVLAELLEIQGHCVCAIVATEADAVAAALKLSPEMLIVDVRLRMGCGLGAVDRIQGRRLVAHVFVCGDASGVRALRPGATVIQKPYLEQDLTLALQRALDTVAAA